MGIRYLITLQWFNENKIFKRDDDVKAEEKYKEISIELWYCRY